MSEGKSQIILPQEIQEKAEGQSPETAFIAASFVAFLQASLQMGQLTMDQVISVTDWVNRGVQAMSRQQNGRGEKEIKSR